VTINFDERNADELPEVERVELFRIDGVTYSIPKVIEARRLLGFMQEMRASGTEAATVGLLIDCIGQQGYNKLLGLKTLRTADLKAIFDVVSTAAMGSMEELTGN